MRNMGTFYLIYGEYNILWKAIAIINKYGRNNNILVDYK